MSGARTPIHGRNHADSSADPIVVWMDVTLETPWTNAGDPFHNVQFGRGVGGLAFRGAATGGTGGDVMFFLPSAYWPIKDEHYVWALGTAPVIVEVSSIDGSVTPLA